MNYEKVILSTDCDAGLNVLWKWFKEKKRAACLLLGKEEGGESIGRQTKLDALDIILHGVSRFHQITWL